MARGNDPTAAEEFAGQYGAHGNAEGLIQENRLRHPREVREASLKPFDRNATIELSLEEVESQAPEDNVIAFAVHGDRVVYVYEDDRGDQRKGVIAYDRKGSKPKDLPDEDRAGSEVEADLRAQHEASMARKEAAAARNKQVREEVEEAEQKAVEKAQKDAASDKPGSGGSGSGGSKG